MLYLEYDCRKCQDTKIEKDGSHYRLFIKSISTRGSYNSIPLGNSMSKGRIHLLSQPSGEEAGVFIHQMSIRYRLSVASVAVFLVHIWLILMGQESSRSWTEALSKQPSAGWAKCREDTVWLTASATGVTGGICNTGQALDTKRGIS